MDAKTDLKSRLPSRHVTVGPERAPHRSYYCAMGLTTAQIRQPVQTARKGVAAADGSTNATLHLPAIAHECGIDFDLFDVAEIFKKTPCIADLKPGGRYVAKDMFEAGGIPLPMNGDIIEIDAHTGVLNVKLSDAELAERRRKAWKPKETQVGSCILWKYMQQVGPAVSGAVTHPGGAHEKKCYADT